MHEVLLGVANAIHGVQEEQSGVQDVQEVQPGVQEQLPWMKEV